MAIPGVAEQIARKINCRGKRQTAAFIYNLCSSNTDNDLRDEIFDMILNPNIPIDDFEVTDWSQWILAGGKTPEEYAQAVSKYDNATACGLVWTANFVAYRCRTCGISPCMSLCSDCFQRGNHKGHDFNMFRSQAGGACDCGDKSVMKESGFCERHGSQSSSSKTDMPEEFLCVPRVFMPRLFLRLIQHLRDYSQEIMSNTNRKALMLMDCFVLLLRKHSELAAQLRSVITEALTDSEVYYQLAVYYDVGKFGASHIYKMKNVSKYLIAKNVFEMNFDEDESLLPTTDISHDSLKNSSFLDELVFWTIKFEFPQNLVCLLLNMMPDFNYKVAFTKIFVQNYDSISKMIASAAQIGSEAVSNRVVHVSVQLFSNEEVAYCMAKHHDLLKIMIKSIHSMMTQITQKSALQCADKNCHKVVDCSHSLMKDHSYWAVASDLNNVLAHDAVAFEFLSDTSLLQMLFNFLSLFQGMDVNQRELKDHVEFESNTYYAAFAAELEASATPMWALISHLKSPETLDKTKKVLEICVEAISQWFEAISFHHGDEINPYQISFHIPLHRYFACFLGQAIRHQNATLDSLLPTQSMLEMMMMHPLQTQVVFHEILSNMWVRCGIQIKGQAMTYIQCHFCNSFVDADLLLLQICAMKLNPDWFLKTVMRRFHVWEWLTFHPSRSNSFLEQDKVLPMVEGALSFLAMLLSSHTNLGMTEQEVARQEMVTLLCMADRTHSQLLDTLPEKCGENTSQNKDFEKILSLIADYKSPNFEVSGTMVQGTFVLKGEVWEEEYDPIHVLLRAVHRREYQSSLDRYIQYLRQSNKFSSSRPPWPPYRIPGAVHKEFIDPRRILHSKTMHGIIFTILHRAVNDPDLPEQILSLCIYLLDMALQFPFSKDPDEEMTFVSLKNKKNLGEVEDVEFEDWFDSSETLKNVSKEIGRILVTEKVTMSMRMVEEMEVDEEIEEDIDMGLELYEIQSPTEEVPDPMTHSVQLQEFSSTVNDSLMALPPSSSDSTINHLVPVSQGGEMVPVQTFPSPSVSTSSTSGGSGASHAIDIPDSNSYNMALIPTSGGLTTLKPHHMRLKRVPGRHRLLLSDKGLPLEKGYPLAIECCNSDDSSTSGDHKYMSFSSKRTIVVNESILSLLLQLHSKMSEKPDSYQVKSRSSCSNSRIGDGVFFIENTLDRIASSSEENFNNIQKIKNRLWPMREENNASPSTENIDKEERRRRAKERQQKLMAEFASKQKAFMQKTKETDFSEGASAVDGGVLDEGKYECVICGQMSASEENRPVGMVVLLQATSVVGHCHQMADRRLPCSDEDRIYLTQGKSLAAMQESRVELLSRQFDNRHWPMSVNIGWEGGVHVQSCGHYLHIDCHKSYIQSLKSQNQLSSRLQNLAVDRGEYSCPLCRQLANSVIPLSPAYLKNSALVKSPSRQFDLVALELTELMSSILSDRESMLLKKYMGAIIEDITNATFPQYRSLCSPNPSSLFLFVNSISRTNLEIELVQQGGTLLKPFKKKPCFVPLMHVLSLHSRLLMTTVVYSTNNFWPRLTGQMQCDHYSLALWDIEVPLLLRDPIALLLQIVLTLPLNIEKAYFSCIVQVLYNFLYIQGLVQLTCAMKSSLRSFWLKNGEQILKSDCDDECNRVPSVLMTYVIRNLQNCSFYLDDDENLEEAPSSEEDTNEFLATYCLHFLKIASLLQSHLYEEDIPTAKESESEFELLSDFLGLEANVGANASSCRLKWVVPDVKRLVDTWCEDFCNFATKAVVAARALIIRHIRWFPPSLLKLPYNYDDIFKYYYKRQCPVCQTEPRDPSLCLVCGTMVCLREYCCRQSTHSEAVLHSVACGAGTAMYLAVNSSTIIVIRGKRACLWGSVYLDSYGEEDRDLKRGKPLYLCEERYNLLQQQWINHSFDHTNKRWVWHKDNL